MAASANPTDLTYLLECSICLNRFRDPRVLPCLHSYCLECLKTHVTTNTDKDGDFNCPECREKCSVPGDGVELFPKNFFVNAMKDVIPASYLQEPSVDGTSSSGPVMCKYYSEENASEHGTAVIFCAQCNAHFCKACSKPHGLFDATKEHKVVPVGDTKPDEQVKQSLNCGLHQNHAINWYCETCKVPACADCILESHKDHYTQKLSEAEAGLKEELLDVSKLAAKHIEYLQEQLADLNANQIKMEDELDQTSKDVSDTADRLRKMVEQREVLLQEKIKEVREDARKRFTKAEQELESIITNTSSLKSIAGTLHEASSENAVCTVLQAPINKQRVMHQKTVPVPLVQWDSGDVSLKCRHNKLVSAGFLGNISVKTSDQIKKVFLKDDIHLAAPIKITTLDYAGKNVVCGIAPIYRNMVCIAHSGEQYVWVYRSDGHIQGKITIPGIAKIFSLSVVDGSNGSLAIADGVQPKVHFVTLKQNLEVLLDSTDVPVVPQRLSGSWEKELVVNNVSGKKCVVLNTDSKVLSEIQVSTSHEKVYLQCVLKTRSGFVTCDKENKEVNFTDPSGCILHTCNVIDARPAVQTMSGHVLIPDGKTCDIKVFMDSGEFLGNLHEKNYQLKLLRHIHIDESEKLMYVACGSSGENELRTYSFKPGDLQLPVTHNITKLTMNVKLIDV